MLGGSLLNATHYASIRLSGAAVVANEKREQNLFLHVTVELVGRRIQLPLAAQIQFRGSELQANGSLALSHRQPGPKSFSAAVGPTSGRKCRLYLRHPCETQQLSLSE